MRPSRDTSRDSKRAGRLGCMVDMRRHTRGPFYIHENERNWVYSLWAGDVCLYVGLTNDLKRRLESHRYKPWWSEVTRVVSDEVIGRSAAMEFEAHDIRKFRPRHNINHNPDHHKPFLGGIPVENRGVRSAP